MFFSYVSKPIILYKFKQMCYNTYTLWGLIMKVSELRQSSKDLDMALFSLDLYLQETEKRLWI